MVWEEKWKKREVIIALKIVALSGNFRLYERYLCFQNSVKSSVAELLDKPWDNYVSRVSWERIRWCSAIVCKKNTLASLQVIGGCSLLYALRRGVG